VRDLGLLLELTDKLLDYAWSYREVETDDLWREPYRQTSKTFADLRIALLDEAQEVVENEAKWDWFMALVQDLDEVWAKVDEIVGHLTDDIEKVRKGSTVEFCEGIDHEHRIAYDNLRRSADSAKQ